MDTVESAIADMRTDVAVIRANYVTRAEFEVLSCTVEKLQATNATKEELAKLSAQVDKLQATSATKDELAKLSAKVDVITANYVTREYLAQVINTLTWRTYGFGTVLCSGLVAATYYISRSAH